MRYCCAYLERYEDAEDAAQDVLATLTAGANLPEGRVKPWLYRVARNRCLNLLARRMDAREGAGSVVRDSRWNSPRTGPRTGPRTAALRAEARERVRHVLAEMSDEHRDVLILRYFEGLRRKEIAEVLCIAETVVRSRLYRASMKLREALGETEAQL